MQCQETLPAALYYSFSVRKTVPSYLCCYLSNVLQHLRLGPHIQDIVCHCQVCKYSSCLLAAPLSINITSSLDQTHDNENIFRPSNSASDLKVPSIKGDLSP